MLSASARYQGCLIGLATGDALGTTVEFDPPGSFTPVTELVGGGHFELQAGQWTDDTSMALCLATSLVETGQFDPRDQMQRYVRWEQQGYLSSTGHCFDIGNTVRAALARFRRTGDPFAGSPAEHAAGNGSLMRLAPVPMAYARQPARALHQCAESSRTTHGAPAAVDACRFFGGLLVGALAGTSKAELLAPGYCPDPRGWEALHPAVAEVAAGSYRHKQPPAIRGTGYVVDCLEAALWAFAHSTNFRAGALLAVNLGDDADTTGAVYGQLAGAYYGIEAIPAEWRSVLTDYTRLETLAAQLLAYAEKEVN